MKSRFRVLTALLLTGLLSRPGLAAEPAPTPAPPTPAAPEPPPSPSPPAAVPAASAPAGPASYIVLRTGQVLEGTILDRLPNGYLVRLSTGTKVVAYEEVASVDGPGVGATPAAAAPPAAAYPPPIAAYSAAAEARPVERFGRAGQLVVTQSFGYVSHTDDTTSILLDPAINVFVTDYLTLGIELSYYRTSRTTGTGSAQRTTSSSSMGAAFNLGVNAPVAPVVSLWPNVSAGYVTPDQGMGTVLLGGGLSILFHPAPHFFVGLTPELRASRLTEAGQSFEVTQALSSMIGGWW